MDFDRCVPAQLTGRHPFQIVRRASRVRSRSIAIPYPRPAEMKSKASTTLSKTPRSWHPSTDSLSDLNTGIVKAKLRAPGDPLTDFPLRLGPQNVGDEIAAFCLARFQVQNQRGPLAEEVCQSFVIERQGNIERRVARVSAVATSLWILGLLRQRESTRPMVDVVPLAIHQSRSHLLPRNDHRSPNAQSR